MKEHAPAPSGIILFAKQPGKTSFSSLFTVKHALNTTKVGHTGTLDSFAQGLLVVLSGSLTRLVPYITAFDKTYEAVITFGAETDTLDPTGKVIKTAPLPLAASFTGAVARFRGALDQKPPLFSAIHVDGKRASDIAVKGGSVDIPSRKITVYSSEIIEMRNENGEIIPPFDLSAASELVKYAHVRFHVSKGTYIRSLARDIAAECGSAGHLAGLLRTKVGDFSLEEAAGADLLKSFTIENVLAENEELAVHKTDNHETSGEEELQQAVREKMKGMTPDAAAECGLVTLILKTAFEDDYFNGRPLKTVMFEGIEKTEKGTPYAVFTEDGCFSGVVSVENGRLRYQYVVPRPKKENPVRRPEEDSAEKKDRPLYMDGFRDTMKIFFWNEIMAAYKGENSEVRTFFKEGSALTIGGFDGPHAGHLKLFDAVLLYAAEKERFYGCRLKKGVVTFSKPPHSICSPNLFSGEISTLALKTDLFALKGFDFVIVIDFSSDFSRMKGNDFLSILKDCCSMQFAAAGCDFRCGYQLDTGVAELSAFARQNDFQFQVIDDVTYHGTRISSSLIRTCVQTGRLHEAEMLLGRPYTVDLRNVTGLIRNDVHCLLQIANGDVLQVLPPNGTYQVKASSAGARTCDTVLHVDSSLLRLEIPPEWSSTGIETIEFKSLVS